MIIQINTDKNIEGNEKFVTYFNSIIEDDLELVSEHITRIEAHFSDENSSKNGQNDKRCMLEARLKNRQPIAVTSHANTVEQALNDALAKLKASMETIYGQLKKH